MNDNGIEEALRRLSQARESGRIAASTEQHVRQWLTDPVFASYRSAVLEHVQQERFKQLDDAFWAVLPFGTGGRRGPMYSIGTNTMNDRTVGESAQGLAEYLRSQGGDGGELSCVIAYDTRHRSESFARLSAAVLAANGIRVYLFGQPRATPELSFMVRHLGATAGVVISASHNPPSDNGFKCYWSSGGQVLPPHDVGIMRCVAAVREVRCRDFDQAVADGSIRLLGQEADRAYVAAVAAQSLNEQRRLRIVYSPLHGVGGSNVAAVLRHCGFDDLHLVASQSTLDGDFSTVPEHRPNPEWPPALGESIRVAGELGADLVLASDPDADRIGAAAVDPTTGCWEPLNGNQIAALLTDYVVRRRGERGELPAQAYVVKTLVTTELVGRIAEAAGVGVVGDLPVGFKWIGRAIDEHGPERFVFAAEESHGYLCGSYARDKDGAVGALLLAELAAELKAAGTGLWQRLSELYRRHGLHVELTLSKVLPGRSGAELIGKVMAELRRRPPRKLGGLPVARLLDYGRMEARSLDGRSDPQPLSGQGCEQLVFELAQPNWRVVARPSGTEPKIKFYYLGCMHPEGLNSARALEEARRAADHLMHHLTADMNELVRQIAG